jgi:hypothetical protein
MAAVGGAAAREEPAVVGGTYRSCSRTIVLSGVRIFQLTLIVLVAVLERGDQVLLEE